MSEQEIDRKITVIFATDVVGYSKHMEANESGTVINLRACEKILTGLFEKHKGRLFNKGGDSFLAEFPSAVSAIECAVEFQKAIKERNSSDEASVKLKFRIGINSGDVIKEKDNLLGDGVNIAARLEALAQSGGITISKVIYDYVKSKTQYEFNDLGLQKIKQNEFHAFDLLLDESQKRKLNTTSASNPVKYGLFSAIVILIIAVLAYVQVGKDFQPIDEKNLAYEIPEGPSITVAKFQNLNPSEDTNYLKKSITDNIVSVLSGSPDLLVMSPDASSAAKSENPEIKEIAEATGVRYVLTGNYQVINQKIRVNVQLNDALKGKTLWSQIFDSNIDDLFDVLDKIANSVFTEVQVQVAGVNSADLSFFKTNVDYLEHQKCNSLFRERNPDSNKQAERCIQALLERDPKNPVVLYLSGWNTFQRAWMGWSSNPEQDKANSRKIAEGIIDDYPGPPYLLLGWIDLVNGDIESVKQNASLALEVAPKNNTVLPVAASLLRRVGNYEAARPAFEKTIRTNPNPMQWVWFEYAGTLIALKDYTKAKELLQTALTRQEIGTQNVIVLMHLAAIAVFENDMSEAKLQCKTAKEATPNFDLEKNLKAISTTTDTEFYNSFIDAVKLACA
jgi:TolB-like protein/class 3 adenylate cyclase